MAKLVDAHGLEPCDFGLGGSNPLRGTNLLHFSMLFLLLFFLFTPKIVQATNTDQVLNDHLYQRALYTKKLTEYQEKLQINQQFSSVSTQEDLIKITQEILGLRALTLKTYLGYLNTSLSSHQDANLQITVDLQTKLSDWENYLTDQITKISITTSLEEFANISLDFNTQYPQIQQTIYLSLIQSQLNLQSKIYQLLVQTKNDIQQNNPSLNPLWTDKINQNLASFASQNQLLLDSIQKNQDLSRLSRSYLSLQKQLNDNKQILSQIYLEIQKIKPIQP